MFVTFFPPEAGLVWIYLPEGAKTVQTVLKPKAEGQSGLFWLPQVSISRLVPPPAGRMLQTTTKTKRHKPAFKQRLIFVSYLYISTNYYLFITILASSGLLL